MLELLAGVSAYTDEEHYLFRTIKPGKVRRAPC